jgi:hypothetical protein
MSATLNTLDFERGAAGFASACADVSFGYVGRSF